MTEAELLRRCRAGKPDAQRFLYEKYSGAMMSVCLRYASDRDEASDILQDSFIKVFEKLDQFKGTGSIGGWIKAIVINTALIHLRKNKKWSYNEDIEDQHDISSAQHGVLESMAADEIHDIIRDMPKGYRTVFNLFAIEGYSHKEIAELLEITENTSKTQFHKSKAYLRKRLEALNRRTTSER